MDEKVAGPEACGRVLVAGATGAVGSALLELLHDRHVPVRALVRHPQQRDRLSARATDVFVGDATDQASLAGICDGIDVVFSSLGASIRLEHADRRSFHRVDTVANSNLLEEAKRARVRRFVYVSLFVTPAYENTAYVRAHETVVDALRTSGMQYVVVRPTGIFTAFSQLLAMARKGTIPVVGDGSARTNPIHAADVAEACLHAIASNRSTEIAVGGPDILTRADIAKLAFRAVEKPERLRLLPAWALRTAAATIRPFHPRLGELMAFGAAVATTDGIAPRYGTRRLGDWFVEQASFA